MIRKSLSTAFLLLLLVGSNVYAQQLKIVYMNTQLVLNELPRRSEVEQELSNYIESKRGELEEKIASFQDEVAQYQKNKSNMSDQQIKQREEELTQQESEMRQFLQDIHAEIHEHRAALIQELYDPMDQAIADVAHSNDLDFVLTQATASRQNLIYYAADQQLNITQEVIQRIK